MKKWHSCWYWLNWKKKTTRARLKCWPSLFKLSFHRWSDWMIIAYRSLYVLSYDLYLWVMVFNATFNNISVIFWRSVLLVEETGVPGENHRPVTSHWQTLSYNVVSSTPLLRGIQIHNIIATDCTGNCKSIYHTITTTTKFCDQGR